MTMMIGCDPRLLGHDWKRETGFERKTEDFGINSSMIGIKDPRLHRAIGIQRLHFLSPRSERHHHHPYHVRRWVIGRRVSRLGSRFAQSSFRHGLDVNPFHTQMRRIIQQVDTVGKFAHRGGRVVNDQDAGVIWYQKRRYALFLQRHDQECGARKGFGLLSQMRL